MQDAKAVEESFLQWPLPLLGPSYPGSTFRVKRSIHLTKSNTVARQYVKQIIEDLQFGIQFV